MISCMKHRQGKGVVISQLSVPVRRHEIIDGY